MRIAMWSGPRNLSTAMMYAFAARGDFDAVDEPFYAAYLDRTGLQHPMRKEILASQYRDPARVADQLRESAAPHLYMKHMTHHMLPDFPMDWAEGCVHVHLIRHPARVIASYAAKRSAPTLEDIGYVQQSALYNRIGGLVIDSTDIRADPEGMLRKLCDAIALPFDRKMLSWEAGPRPYDGVWAPHWYGTVQESTGFAGAEGPPPSLPPEFQPLMAAALPHYQRLARDRLE